MIVYFNRIQEFKVGVVDELWRREFLCEWKES